MLKRLLFTAIAVMLAVTMGYADQQKAKVVIPVGKVTPTNGKLMYSNYCASCHGVDGRGNGPVATALKTQPTDLTVLSKNNRGKFPDTHVVSVLENGTDVRAHGVAEMPIWGPILGKMNQGDSQARMLRISNLSHYLETIQAK